MSQIANTVLMLRPVAFRYNDETAVNNYFQQKENTILPATANAKAQEEFDALVQKLKMVGVKVIVAEDTKEMESPDSIFLSSWISFHESGDVALYPMFAKNRRKERREDLLDILEGHGFQINEIMDYTEAEEDDFFLEGTASLILDRENDKAYCALSPRTDEELAIEFCEDFEYSPLLFEAFQTIDGDRKLVHHTNMVLFVGNSFAIFSSESVDDKKERKMLLDSLRNDGKEIILISEEQARKFAANCIELRSKDDRRYLIMSETAYGSLTKKQTTQIEEHLTIIHSDLSTIEILGGGSISSMMAEIFLPMYE